MLEYWSEVLDLVPVRLPDNIPGARYEKSRGHGSKPITFLGREYFKQARARRREWIITHSSAEERNFSAVSCSGWVGRSIGGSSLPKGTIRNKVP